MAFRLRPVPRRSRAKGQTLVEVTLIIPLLILLVGATLDLGLLFFVSHVVQNAVREGARAAVTTQSGTTETDLINNVIKPKMPAVIFDPYKSSLDISCSGSPPIITVTATGTFNYMFLRFVGLTQTTITRNYSIVNESHSNCPSWIT